MNWLVSAGKIAEIADGQHGGVHEQVAARECPGKI
jgi:hypothetical protein